MNKKTIPALVAMLALCLGLFGLSACKAGGDDSFSIHPDADGFPASEEANAPAEEDPADGVPPGNTPAPADAPVEAPADEPVYMVTGIIDDAAMSKFYVLTDDGRTIPFPYQEADIDALDDTRPGSPITVYYTGALDGEDASGVTVLRMETPA